MKRKVSASTRRRYKRMRKVASRYECTLYGKINKERDNNVSKLLKSIKGKTIKEAKKTISKLKNEDYFKAIYLQMYDFVGMDIAKQQVALFGISKKAEDNILEAQWRIQLQDFAKKYAGIRIKTLTNTLKNDLMSYLDKIVANAVEEGIDIERVTDEIVNLMGTEYKGARWQARRIAHSETMQCASKAQSISVDSLGIKYLKIWQITGIRTRDQHLMMSGVAVLKGKPFTMPNGDKMMFPQDSSMGASAINIINCSCYLIYEPVK